MPEIEEVRFVDRERILEDVMVVADEASTWITECCLSADDKEAAVICLAEISGAVRLAKELLGINEFVVKTVEDNDDSD